jgi:hypothetical protein
MTGQPESASDQRICDRTALRQAIVIRCSKVGAVTGHLVNVSLGGVLVELPGGMDAFAEGDTVALCLSPDDSASHFACRVVRSHNDQLALTVARNSAARFGLALTRGLFAKAKSAKTDAARSA